MGLPPARRLDRLLREPLLHFLLAGLVLFLGYTSLSPTPEQRPQSRRIELTEDDLRQISVAWLAQRRSAPTEDEMRSLVEDRVREEILYREALALGLDSGDTIIRRRLAQKVEFLFEDVAALREPTAAELRSWFESNVERFVLPARHTFRHLYFSPDRRGERARQDAARARETLDGRTAKWPGAAALADPFMFQNHYGDRSFDEIARTFGGRFARELFQLEPGSWQGPIESGYGWHLVWIDSITPARAPAFEDVEADVKTAWLEDQRAEVRRRAYEAMKARYEVVLPDDFVPRP
jgi:hypothetical protein